MVVEERLGLTDWMRQNNIGQNIRQNTIAWAVIEDSYAWCRLRLSVRR